MGLSGCWLGDGMEDVSGAMERCSLLVGLRSSFQPLV